MDKRYLLVFFVSWLCLFPGSVMGNSLNSTILGKMNEEQLSNNTDVLDNYPAILPNDFINISKMGA